MANVNPFVESRNLFAEYLGWEGPLTYEQWHNSPQEKKSAILFVQFFDNICQAWHKADTFSFGDPDEGVETMCAYLEKNIAKIEESEGKKFTAPYIYRVAYNCLYCICHDRKRDKDRWENEIPNIVNYDGEELDLFETVVDMSSGADQVYEKDEFLRAFWSAVEDAGQPAEKVIDYLLSGNKSDLLKIRKTSSNYSIDPLRDVEVKLEDVDVIVAKLREALAPLRTTMQSY